MDKRRSKRKKININAEVVSDDATYDGIIDNVSERGIYLEITADDPLISEKKFNPGRTVEVKFRLPSGEKLNLRCNIMWSFKTQPHGLTNNVGMEIVFPPPSYIDFYKSHVSGTVSKAERDQKK